ncbi:SLATT domain-containing protein [Escherichia coli]|nr:SLATT domain-containing protein [Escherichia coli]
MNTFAVICAVVRVANVDVPFWPTDIFVASAASILTWMQAKRFSELAASYSLTSHEIGLVKEEAKQPNTDEEFSVFVGDAENAFSREHTQWVARKDV